MRSAAGAVVSSLLGCALAFGQSQHTVWDCDTLDGSDCQLINSSVMGGLRFEDYQVTNPAAVQFDPAQRLKELAALGPSTVDTLCAAPPVFTTPAPAITFRSDSVVAQIFYRAPAASFSPPEFMDVQFANFTASNGFTSPGFGFRMTRLLALDGSEVPQYNIQLQVGNAGLENVPGLPPLVGFSIDPVAKNATFIGTTPSSALLREAILGVLLNAQSILNAAKFTVTNPAPSGKTLWSGSEILSLAGQAQPWIAAATGTTVPLGPPFSCQAILQNGRGTCNGQDQMDAFTKMILTWGGEYLGLRTPQSFNVLVSNLVAWATANAPSVDPDWAVANPGSFPGAKENIAMPILMLWPTLRADPAMSAADRQTIDNWIVNWLMPPFPPGPDYFPNDLGYYADSIQMANAIRRSDNATFAFGIQRFYGALNQMRPDGSFPLAALLSACSAVYSNVDLLHLVSFAEMAATQGYDLYSMSVNGKTLETAIEFLLNAYENPALLYQYSKAGGGACFEGNPGDPPDFTAFKHPDASLAWMEPYIARFPFSATAARLRKILGSNISAPPFPLTINYTGLNASCAFRKSYEFQPVSGAKVAIISGDGQTVAANQPAPAPLSVRITDNSGKALAGVLVSFAVVQGSANLAAPAQVLTDATGMASASVTMGPVSGPVTVTATALGAPASFSIVIPGPAISSGGIGGIGASVPAVTTISPGALFSIYGQNFVPEGSGRRVNPDELVNGVLPSALLGVCVSVGGLGLSGDQRSGTVRAAPIWEVYPGQINAVAPVFPPGSTVEIIVTTGCGTEDAIQSMPQLATVAAASPEFLYFAHNANGQNPVEAVNSVNGSNVGPAELGPGFAPAQPGDLVTIFASGLGPTNPRITPGAVPSATAQVTSPVTVTLGSVTLDASDVLYAGAAPGELFSQIKIRIPSGAPAGNQPLQIQIGDIASPPGAFLAIAAP